MNDEQRVIISTLHAYLDWLYFQLEQEYEYICSQREHESDFYDYISDLESRRFHETDSESLEDLNHQIRQANDRAFRITSNLFNLESEWRELEEYYLWEIDVVLDMLNDFNNNN